MIGLVDLAPHVGDMSATSPNVAKSWPTLRVVATRKSPRHTQFSSITARQVQVSPNVRVSYPTIEFLCLNSNNNQEIADMSGIPRHVVKCRVV